MEILNGKYQIVNMKLEKNEPAVISVHLKSGRQTLDLTKIDEKLAEELVESGSAYLKKKGSSLKKASGSS